MTIDAEALVDDLQWCLQSPLRAEPVESAADWARGWRATVAEGHRPIGLALRGGFSADRLAWAFGAGYQAALRTLVTVDGADDILTLCATEAGGNRPGAIATELRDGAGGTLRLSGRKRWSTYAPLATRLLVVATDARSGATAPSGAPGPHRRTLRVVCVNASSAGLSIRTMPPTAFVPEARHAEVDLDEVQVAEADVLPGDGYSRYVKPFRTAEDIFVSAACAAYLLREARTRQLPQDFLERIVVCLQSLGALADQPFDAPAVHIALAGTLALWSETRERFTRLLPSAGREDTVRMRWLRDQPLFNVASQARSLRAARAWERVGAGQ